ncbi:hypothetical protein HPB50_012095 [Hyalomma asiaticum]|uniref:Uncharacterized protein n=1 Tax=Hyalomma asiaticum TaxID=266040 RepID=A0ACB7SKA4_HYAAI|nr:hypothetical protein HPB50_012095 [Hyalomma asiaticum]
MFTNSKRLEPTRSTFSSLAFVPGRKENTGTWSICRETWCMGIDGQLALADPLQQGRLTLQKRGHPFRAQRTARGLAIQRGETQQARVRLVVYPFLPRISDARARAGAREGTNQGTAICVSSHASSLFAAGSQGGRRKEGRHATGALSASLSTAEARARERKRITRADREMRVWLARSRSHGVRARRLRERTKRRRRQSGSTPLYAAVAAAPCLFVEGEGRDDA